MPLLVSVSPYVPTAGAPYAGHQWYHHLLAALSAHYEVVGIAPATEENRSAAAGAPVRFHLAPGRGHWAVAERQRNPLDKLRDELLEGVVRVDAEAASLLGAADVVDVQWPRALPHVPEIRRLAPRGVVTAVEHDVQFTNWEWRRLGALPPGRRLVGAAIGPAVRRRELRLLRACDAFFAFKQSDIDLVARCGVSTPGHRLSPWLDQPPPGPRPLRRPEALFVAAFDRPQNQWGARWLLERVWPSVRASVGEAKLVLAGGGMPDDLRAAAARAGGVEVTGFVEDLGPLYQRAGCVLAPVLGGAGLRFKVPQAMVYAAPLVVTPLALEGMEDAPPGCFVAVSDDPARFAAAVVDALGAGPSAAAAGEAAAEWVGGAFSFPRSVEAMLEVWDAAHRGRARHNS